jgi:hypothetical protein
MLGYDHGMFDFLPIGDSRGATKPRGRWLGLALAAYFGVSAALGAFIHDGTAEGISAGLARALGTLFIPTLIALIVARRKKAPVRLDIVLVCAAVIHVYVQRERIMSAIDVYQFKAELRGAAAEDIPAVIAASRTNTGRSIAGAMSLLEDYSRVLQELGAEIDDPAFAELLEPRRLTDPAWRAAILPKLDSSRAAAAGFMARADAAAADVGARIRAISPPGMSDNDRARLLDGMTEGLRDNRSATAAHISAVERYLGACAEMVRFLGTPEGRPALNAQGRLDFQTHSALDAFRDVAGRVDDAQAALRQSAQDLQARRRQSLHNIQALSQ